MSKLVIKDDNIGIVDLVVKAGFASSTSEARRLISQNAVSIGGSRITDVKKNVFPDGNGKVLKVGKRKFCRVLKG